MALAAFFCSQNKNKENFSLSLSLLLFPMVVFILFLELVGAIFMYHQTRRKYFFHFIQHWFFLLSFSPQTNGNMIKKKFVSTMNQKTTFQTFIDSLENELLSFGDCNKHFADFTIYSMEFVLFFFSFLSVV